MEHESALLAAINSQLQETIRHLRWANPSNTSWRVFAKAPWQ